MLIMGNVYLSLTDLLAEYRPALKPSWYQWEETSRELVHDARTVYENTLNAPASTNTDSLHLFSRLFLHRGQQAGVRAGPQRHTHTCRPGSPTDVPGPQPCPARPGRPPRRPAHQWPTQPSSWPPPRPTHSAPGHPAPPPLQVPHHLWTLPGSQDQAVALPFTWYQRTHVPPPHEPSHS